MYQKRVLAIHDISCFGRCSLTVALPIISAMGIETVALPTAILSTHTGGFTGFTYRDLTCDIEPICKHWETLGLKFDVIYTGFLGSFEQIDLVAKIFEKYKAMGTSIAVDPVMADNGKLYSIFNSDFPQGMKRLCEMADIIMPNITEASLILNEQYREGPYEESYIDDMLVKLSKLGPNKVVLTGVYHDETNLGARSYDKNTGVFSFSSKPRIEGYYHGTGDVFGSALVGAIAKGKSTEMATQIAVDYTVGSIDRTFKAKTDIRFGVNFEEGIPELIKLCSV
ncbi:MAG: pyridoxamine kinase [Christensenellaceae bacterium]|jgi:pyridoxine kinase|nr:pyridoxamine kinase [Christensenellaceae bacterium]